jgi:DNA modification methylase
MLPACYRCKSSPCVCKDGITLIHGDCREVLVAMDDASIDMIFTDPPYGHNNNNNGDLIHRWEAALGRLPCGENSPLESRPIANDGVEANDLVRWFFKQSKRLLRDCCCCCCCGGGGGPDPQFARWSLWLDEVLSFKQMVVWDKGPMGMGWHYRRSYETVLVANKSGGKCKWFGGRTVENIIRPGDYGIRKITPSKDQHPTPKPVGLPAHFISLHSKPGEVVLDPFCGCGSTLRAAKDGNRRAIGVEISEEYCEATANRLRQEVFFGKETPSCP